MAFSRFRSWEARSIIRFVQGCGRPQISRRWPIEKVCISLFKRKERQIDWGGCTRGGIDFEQETNSDIKRWRKAINRSKLGQGRTWQQSTWNGSEAKNRKAREHLIHQGLGMRCCEEESSIKKKWVMKSRRMGLKRWVRDIWEASLVRAKICDLLDLLSLLAFVVICSGNGMHLGFEKKKMKLAFMLVWAFSCTKKKKLHFSVFKFFQALDNLLNGF